MSGEGFDIFYRFLRAMDGEYVTHTAEQVKIAMDKAKRGQETRHDG